MKLGCFKDEEQEEEPSDIEQIEENIMEQFNKQNKALKNWKTLKFRL